MEDVELNWGAPRHTFGQSTMGSHRNGFKKEGFILSVDVGTTSIRCHVYDKQANIRGSCTTKVCLAFPSSSCFTRPSPKSSTCMYHIRCNIWVFYPVIIKLMFCIVVIFYQVVPLYPEVGYVEMDPEALWTGFITVVKGAVQGTVTTSACCVIYPQPSWGFRLVRLDRSAQQWLW